MTGIDLKLTALTELTTVGYGDLFYIVHDPDGTPVWRKISINNLLTSWIPMANTWTYASATTITVPSGAASIYSIGDKIRFKQGAGYKYFYIIAVADTLLTVTGGSDYTVATPTAITDIYYSKATSPVDFPQTFNYTPAITFTAGTAPTTPNTGGVFSIVGKICILNIYITYTNAGATVTGCSIPLPIPSSPTTQPAFGSITATSGINPCHADIASSAGRIVCSSVSANRVIFGATYKI